MRAVSVNANAVPKDSVRTVWGRLEGKFTDLYSSI